MRVNLLQPAAPTSLFEAPIACSRNAVQLTPQLFAIKISTRFARTLHEFVGYFKSLCEARRTAQARMDHLMNLQLTFAERLPVVTICGIVCVLTLGVLSVAFGQSIPQLW